MTNLVEQAFDTEEFYRALGAERLEEYAVKTGLYNGIDNIDANILLSIVQYTCHSAHSVLEVGCGYGRIGQLFIQHPEIKYWGIELHKPFVDSFKSKVQDKGTVLHGNFLDYPFPFKKIECILFPWSAIGEFSSNLGQISALRRTRSLLLNGGRALFDIPRDVVNKFDGYEPGYFNIHEKYDLIAMELKYVTSHQYTTFTGRNREIIEISAK